MDDDEKDLKREVAIQEAVLESTADAVLVVNNEGEIVAYNQNFVDMWGVPDTILESRDDSQALAHVKSKLEDPDGFMERVYHLYNNPEKSGFDVLEFKDGRVVERYTQPYTVDGEIQGRVWSFHDITYYREVEKKLKRSNAMFETTINASADAIFVASKDREVLYYNEKFRDMFDLPEEKLEDDADDALEHVLGQLKNPEAFKSRVKELYREENLDDKYVDEFEFKDGRCFKRISKPFTVEGEARGRVSSFREITEK